MKARMSIGKEIEKIPLTLTVTLSIEEWRDIANDLQQHRPCGPFRDVIRGVIQKVLDANNVLVSGDEVER